MEKRQVEILAPAGSWDSMKAAIAAGADGVYMGGSRFGARAYADNTDEKGMVEAINYVHLHGRRLYMTVNTLFKEGELDELTDYMTPYYLAGLDGVIVQDLGALRVLKAGFPGLELHASTQMTVTSVYGAKMMKDLGCSRVVTSREMSLEEIRRIHDEVDVEIESFVHGALCYCYSGQCLMSSLIGGRSGNRGRCAQPCRLPYAVFEQRDGSLGEGYMESGGGGKGRSESSRRETAETANRRLPRPLNRENEQYVLSLKDLCTLDILPDIIEAGVYSLKIEGRMKSPRYTAGVVRIYRKYVDLYLDQGRDGYHVEPGDKRELLELFDRGGFTAGYYGDHNGRHMVALKEKPEFREGNHELFDFLDRTYVEAEVKEPAQGVVTLAPGSPATLTLTARGAEVTVKGQVSQPAQKQPMTAEKVEKQINKTGGTPFVFTKLTTHIEGRPFLPVQALNELRRSGLKALEEAILDRYRMKRMGHKTIEGQVRPDAEDGRESRDVPEGGKRSGHCHSGGSGEAPSSMPAPKLTASLESPLQLLPALDCGDLSAIYVDAGSFPPDGWKETVERCHKAQIGCYLMLPHIFREHAIKFFRTNKALLNHSGFDGVIVKALEEVRWLQDEDILLPFRLDASVYGWNSSAVGILAQTGAEAVTLPLELNARELAPVSGACRALGLPSELIVYGHAPMMVSAQCLVRTVKGCSARPELLKMKDRTGNLLPVRNHCTFCYNTIYNPAPTSLLGYEALAGKLGAAFLRMAFTVENEAMTKELLEAFSKAFVHGEPVEAPYKDFTRGHFKRGVE